MPVALKRVMRHKDIQTTLRYYVDQDVDDVANELWAAFERSNGNSIGNTHEKTPVFSEDS